jgi:hypothetical protein
VASNDQKYTPYLNADPFSTFMKMRRLWPLKIKIFLQFHQNLYFNQASGVIYTYKHCISSMLAIQIPSENKNSILKGQGKITAPLSADVNVLSATSPPAGATLT